MLNCIFCLLIHRFFSYHLILLSLGLLIASTSCNDEDITIKIVDLPDAIPYNEIGSGKILFNRYQKTYLIDIDDQSVSE